jgi:hypothetical protein
MDQANAFSAGGGSIQSVDSAAFPTHSGTAKISTAVFAKAPEHGVAVLALSHWLGRIGAMTVLVERRFQAPGHYISLKGNGVEMVRRMGSWTLARRVPLPSRRSTSTQRRNDFCVANVPLCSPRRSVAIFCSGEPTCSRPVRPGTGTQRHSLRHSDHDFRNLNPD